jgi:hypothetical protein
MSFKAKFILGLLAITALVGLGVWGGLRIRDLDQANSQLNSQLMAAKLEVGKAHTEFGQAKDKISLLEKQLQDEIKAHQESITKYGELLAKYNAQGGGTSDPITPPSTDTPPVADKPLFKPGKVYIAQTEYLVIPFDPPLIFGTTDDRLDLLVTILTPPKYDYLHYPVAEFKYELHLKIMAQLVETIAESGAINSYANVFEVDAQGNKVGKFELSSFEVVVEDLRKAKFHLFNPKLDVGLLMGFDGSFIYGGDLGISLASYGLSRNDLTWRFARFSMAFNNKGIGLGFEPALWNVGDPLPIVQNVWIGPNIFYNLNTRLFGGGLILSVSM